MKMVFNWAVFVLIGLGIFNAIRFRHYIGQHLPERGTMTGLQVIIFALSFAFMWVEVLKWWKHIKPFNCLKCMTAWAAVILAFMFHVEFWYMYLPAGLFVGAMFEGIRMRWL